MLTADDATAGATRYRLLETMRQYALDRLDERAEADRWRRRHAAHYAASSDEAGRGLHGPDEFSWRARVAADLDNIRAAVTWSLDGVDEGDTEFALQIVSAFAAEANASASAFGVGAWAERALPAARTTVNAGLRADVVAAAGWNVFVAGDLERGRALALEALAGGLSPDMRAPSLPYVLLGYVEVVLGRMDAAVDRTAEGRAALAALSDVDPFESVTMALSHAAFTIFGTDRDDAEATVADVFRMARELGNPSALANALTIKVVATWVDDPDGARPWLDEGLALVRAGASGVMFGIMLAIQAQLDLHAGDLVGARATIREALDYLGDTGDVPQIVTVVQYAIPVFVASGALAAAAVLAGFSLDGLYAPLGNMPPDVQPRRDAAIERARAELGDVRFAAERSRGASMPLDEVVAFALAALAERLER
jgi:hypothetical protein